MADKKTSPSAAKAASKTLRESSSKSVKTAAGSALSQRPMSKKAHLSSRDTDRAVKNYLSQKSA